jgi:hypothetical protein
MTEEFLQFIWQQRLFEPAGMKTQTGEPVEVQQVGQLNTDSGPDFTNARIKIGDTLWAGNVELHLQSSDWFRHAHHTDKAYDNVILHAVGLNNAVIKRKNGEEIPVLELKFDGRLEQNYEALKANKSWIACETDISMVDPFIIHTWLDRLSVERLESKSDKLARLLNWFKGDWEEAFYCSLLTNLGYKINATPFEMLAKSLPLKILSLHRNNPLQTEALLFGQAGLLEGILFEDPYFGQLRKEYLFLQKKYQLKPLESHIWQFMRLRPVAFPTIRIAQFASFLSTVPGLFSFVIETRELSQIQSVFRAEPSAYWTSHYHFNKPSPASSKSMGADMINSIVINTVVPFLFAYGVAQGNQRYKDRALEFLEKSGAEDNTIIRHWAKRGMVPLNALHTQSLLQLKNVYCTGKKCLQCRIGNHILVHKL